jgi:hypothetical protein
MLLKEFWVQSEVLHRTTRQRFLHALPASWDRLELDRGCYSIGRKLVIGMTVVSASGWYRHTDHRNQGPDIREDLLTYLKSCPTRKALGCGGCHFQPPFSASCDSGCHELYRTFPEDIATYALSILNPQQQQVAA